ncbi:AMP-binding protein, partial [Flavobacterium sp. HJSW_4]|uniref:AMP-binding protein n=1 Tax=Flavobacterium sp. HJSW_4 TaxID=3344660 RepID=UPI0035F446A3
EEQADRTPNNIAVVFEGKELTYKEIDDLSTQLSYSLQNDYNILKGDMIGVQLERSEWSIISILGIMKSGGVYVPIDSELPVKRKAFMVKDADLKLLITETSFILDLDFYEGNVFSIDVEFDPSA